MGWRFKIYFVRAFFSCSFSHAKAEIARWISFGKIFRLLAELRLSSNANKSFVVEVRNGKYSFSIMERQRRPGAGCFYYSSSCQNFDFDYSYSYDDDSQSNYFEFLVATSTIFECQSLLALGTKHSQAKKSIRANNNHRMNERTNLRKDRQVK